MRSPSTLMWVTSMTPTAGSSVAYFAERPSIAGHPAARPQPRPYAHSSLRACALEHFRIWAINLGLQSPSNNCLRHELQVRQPNLGQPLEPLDSPSCVCAQPDSQCVVCSSRSVPRPRLLPSEQPQQRLRSQQPPLSARLPQRPAPLVSSRLPSGPP